MIRQNKEIIKTNSSFWSQLDADIDKYVARGKRNVKIYERKQFEKYLNSKTPRKRKQSEDISPQLSFTSLNELRTKTKEEK